MADALCGPSNALQNFQKHSSVDRTLQQDRLINRHAQNQSFRSSSGPAAGLLDPEFDAFQAGHSGPPPPDFQLHAQPRSHLPHFGGPTQAPDWASDFQRLNIAAPQAPRFQQHAPQGSNAPSSWHQDFMQQQQAPMHQAGLQQPNMLGTTSPGMGWAGSGFQQMPGFGMMNHSPMSEVAHGKQRAAEPVPEFDSAAFDKAFEDVQNELQAQSLREANAEVEATTAMDSEQHDQVATAVHQEARDTVAEKPRLAEEVDPVLRGIQEKRLPVYMAIKLRSAADLGQFETTEYWLDELESIERNGRLTEDASEARWAVEALQKLSTRDTPEVLKSRAESLITAVNQRLMSQYPLLSSRTPLGHDHIIEELRSAGYNTQDFVSGPQEQQAEDKQEENVPKHDDDEMAETAGKLLERVADNTSEKFQNSQFLELMRRLRDREIKVEGDKMVEVNGPPSSIPAPATALPDIDSGILNHSAMDFGMPMDSERENEERLGLSRHSTNELQTDEITEQYSWYPVNTQPYR